jgi:hypothetical protein
MSPTISKGLYWAGWAASIALIAAGIALAVGGSGCVTPGAGGACAGEDAYCESSSVALACSDKHLTAYKCPGPAGCATSATGLVTCDQSENATAGDACLPIYDGRGQCSPDKKALLVCQGTWLAVICPAGTACVESPTGVGCM